MVPFHLKEVSERKFKLADEERYKPDWGFSNRLQRRPRWWGEVHWHHSRESLGYYRNKLRLAINSGCKRASGVYLHNGTGPHFINRKLTWFDFSSRGEREIPFGKGTNCRRAGLRKYQVRFTVKSLFHHLPPALQHHSNTVLTLDLFHLKTLIHDCLEELEEGEGTFEVPVAPRRLSITQLLALSS